MSFVLTFFAIVIMLSLIATIFPISLQNSFASKSINKISASENETSLKKASDFNLPSTTGESIQLSDYSGKKNVLLYFQEGIMCDPCWKQLEDIQKVYDDKFKPLNIEVITITVDPINALIKESQRRGISLPVLDDDKLNVSSTYRMLDNSMHPGSRPGHSFVLIDSKGDILWEKDYYPSTGSNINDMGMNMRTDMNGRMYIPVDELLNEIYKYKDRLQIAESSDKPKNKAVINDTFNGTKTNITSTIMKTQIDDKSQLSMRKTNSSIDSMFKPMSMCLTPIHNHLDLKIYLNNIPLNLSQRNYMDPPPIVHFHPTVKVEPNDLPGIPVGDILHLHKGNVTIHDFLKTIDLDNKTKELLVDNSNDTNKPTSISVYVNGDLQKEGLDYFMQNKDRILLSIYNIDKNKKQFTHEIEKQIESVTNYAGLGKDKNPQLFGGC